MNNQIEQCVEALQHTCIVAELNYEIWWLYKEKSSRERFLDTFDNYPTFFATSLHAHFVAMIIALYRLFETSSHEIANFNKLIKLLKKDHSIDQTNIKKFETEINQHKILWKKVCMLRNNLFAHKTIAKDNDEIWKKASLKPKQIRELINNSKRLLDMITSVWSGSSSFLISSATEDTKRLLEDLKHLSEENL
jgi:AbiU2